jgi:REP element-mobilizing transposase RayT
VIGDCEQTLSLIRRNSRRNITVRIENLLDAGYGACPLRDAECRQILEATIRRDDGHKYRLCDFVIMPNHAYVLMHMFSGYELGDTMKAWKSVSARRIGKHLGKTGTYWMDEYFDHAVRDDEDLLRFAKYIQDNPRNLPPGTFTLGRGSLKTQVPPVPAPAVSGAQRQQDRR